MNLLLMELSQFFQSGVIRSTQDLGIGVRVDIPVYKPCEMATFIGTEHRYAPPVGTFLESRWRKMVEERPADENPAGGIWLGRTALFDFAIEVVEVDGSTVIKGCDCGFYPGLFMTSLLRRISPKLPVFHSLTMRCIACGAQFGAFGADFAS